MSTNVTYLMALTNGFITFFSPCVLPLLPLYFSYMAGEAITSDNMKRIRGKLLMNSIGFILGISFLNLLIGFGARFVSDYLIRHQDIIRTAGGILLLVFGIYFISGKQIAFLEKDRKYVYQNYSPNFLKSLILGFTFSLGWSACNGPIVASISIIASLQRDYFRAGSLMLVYSAGFAIPFMAAALLAGSFAKKASHLKKHLNIVKIIAGIILVIMGILMITNKMMIF